MENSIDLFMWGYQKHLKVTLESTADRVFRLLDKRFSPRIFFVGILIEERNDRHDLCLEPEECGFNVEDFSNVTALAKELESAGDSIIIDSNISENKGQKINSGSYIKAISNILTNRDFKKTYERYISHPIYIDGYLVFVVLELQKNLVKEYYSLGNTVAFAQFKISRSLIESTIKVFLDSCENALRTPDKYILPISRHEEELVREASVDFMYSVSQAGKNFEGVHGLYDTCNAIAAMKYEGSVGIGNLIIAVKDHENIKYSIELEEPIRLNDYRRVRKFLELSDESLSIISDSAFIYGLGELKGRYNFQEESLFVIKFSSHYKWELFHNSILLMIVEYRQPSLPIAKINKDRFSLVLKNIFREIKKEQINMLWDIALEATNQKHGTMLVISDDAINEAERLKKQSFQVKPVNLSNKIINQITAIDGAVLLDRSGNCYAIGVILDGLATIDKGDASRGARYNSAIQYYEYFKDKTSLVLLVISEDGMINLIPD